MEKIYKEQDLIFPSYYIIRHFKDDPDINTVAVLYLM